LAIERKERVYDHKLCDRISEYEFYDKKLSPQIAREVFK